MADIDLFRGSQRIDSLACFPLIHHKEPAAMRATLLATAQKFVSLAGVHYKAHDGLAYMKKKDLVLKVNIDSRIMIDPAIFRRILPNYNVSDVKPGSLGSKSER